VRGLYAPPRRPTAPAAATASAVRRSCSRLSTAQGPATTPTRRPPMGNCFGPMATSVRVRLTSVEAIL